MFYKKGALKSFINAQENTCVRVSFLIKFAGLRPATLLKKRLRDRCFPVSFEKYLQNTFFYRTPHMAAPVKTQVVHWTVSLISSREVHTWWHIHFTWHQSSVSTKLWRRYQNILVILISICYLPVQTQKWHYQSTL